MPIHNLKASQLSPVERRVRRVETQSPGGNSSVSTGQTRFIGLLSIAVEGSGLVTGLWSVDGELRVGGDLNLDGDMVVGGGGSITVGAVEIRPDAGGTGGLYSASEIQLDAPAVLASNNFAVGEDLIVLGEATIFDDLIVFGAMKNPGITTTASPANMYCDPTTNQFYRVTSAGRFKLDAQPLELHDGLLDVVVKDWIDKGAHERGEAAVRIPGVIAEEVAAAPGGESFVGYTADGVVESVHYDRLALARTAILSRKLDAALARIEELEKASKRPEPQPRTRDTKP